MKWGLGIARARCNNRSQCRRDEVAHALATAASDEELQPILMLYFVFQPGQRLVEAATNKPITFKNTCMLQAESFAGHELSPAEPRTYTTKAGLIGSAAIAFVSAGNRNPAALVQLPSGCTDHLKSCSWLSDWMKQTE